MKEYRYEVVVTGWLGRDDRTGTIAKMWGKGVDDLNKLLLEGWVPVRESPMGSISFTPPSQEGMAYLFASLVVLEREKPNS